MNNPPPQWTKLCDTSFALFLYHCASQDWGPQLRPYSTSKAWNFPIIYATMIGWNVYLMKHAYRSFRKKELILRDVLAIERTILSTERTFYSTLRTSLTLLVAGITILHFIENQLFRSFGWIVITTALILVVVGSLRLLSTLKKLRSIAHYAPEVSQ